MQNFLNDRVYSGAFIYFFILLYNLNHLYFVKCRALYVVNDLQSFFTTKKYSTQISANNESTAL